MLIFYDKQPNEFKINDAEGDQTCIKMKKALHILAAVLPLSSLLLVSCKKEEQVVSPPVPGNEFMTTVKIRLENATNVNDTIWATWEDLAPDDLTPPDTSLAVLSIHTNTTYHATVHFYDATQSPATELTPEIIQRANYHSYWFFKTGAMTNHLAITPTDFDTNNPPLFLGLSDDFATDGTAASGRLEGVLRHQPNGKNGTFAPGSTDSDVFFTVNILP